MSFYTQITWVWISSFVPEPIYFGRMDASERHSVDCMYHCTGLVHCFYQRHMQFIGKEKKIRWQEEKCLFLFISKDESEYLSLCVFVLIGRSKMCDFHTSANIAELFKDTARNGLVFLPACSIL